MEGVKSDTAVVRVGMDSVLLLPSGAVYHAQSGRAQVRVSTETAVGGVKRLVVTATCDSLERQVLEQAREIRRLESALSAAASEGHSNAVETTEERKWNGGWFIEAIVSVVAVVAILAVVYALLRRWWQRHV